MFSLRPIIARRAAAHICTHCLAHLRPLSTLPRVNPLQSTSTLRPSPQALPLNIFNRPPQTRSFASKSTADSLIEEIQDQYATAKDEFEIATEETEKQTTYGQADRDAAREELDKLKEMYESALKSEDGEEIKRRVGGRIRELDEAVKALEESVSMGDH
jgi:hypothetical protein